MIGWSSGQVDKYNLQSGKHRASCISADINKAHSAGVTAVCCDAMNKCIVTGSVDGTCKIWDFNKCKLADNGVLQVESGE